MFKLHALDLASNVGSAIMQRGRPPLFQTKKLEGDLARKLGTYEVWLDEMQTVHQFDAVAWERPLLTPTDTVNLLELLYGLVGITYAHAHRFNLPHLEVTTDDVKFALAGAHTKVGPDGRRRKIDKLDMLAAAQNVWNWKVVTDHEADAGGVGIHAMGVLDPKPARPAA